MILFVFVGVVGMQEDVAVPVEGRNKNLIEKVVDFLEADCYLYSPLIVDDHVCSKTHVADKSSGTLCLICWIALFYRLNDCGLIGYICILIWVRIIWYQLLP